MFVSYLRTTEVFIIPRNYPLIKFSKIVYLNIMDHYKIFMQKVCFFFSLFSLKNTTNLNSLELMGNVCC